MVMLVMELTGIEPATFRMRSGRSATELQPRTFSDISTYPNPL